MPETESSPSFLRRFKWVLWKQHQPYIAVASLACLIGMTSFFLYRRVENRGLVDVDSAPQQEYKFQIDINSADWFEIAVLPGVGENLAREIVKYRQQTGPFTSLDDLEKVPGIGPKKYQQIVEYLLPLK